MQENLFCKILKIALYATFIVGVAGTVTLPFLLDFYTEFVLRSVSLSSAYRTFILPFLMVVAVPCLWVVLEMLGMMRTIPQNPFIQRNVRALHRVGILFMGLSIAFIFKCFFFFTFLTMFCVLAFIGAGLFSFVLAALIRQSIVFREENDLTI